MSRFLFYSIVVAFAFIGWFTSASTERVAILFTGIAAFFSYEGYLYNKEKFRLELFEKRWKVYESLHRFNSVLLQLGELGSLKQTTNETQLDYELRKNKITLARDVAEDCFRGIGWHSSQLLFGEDIHSQLGRVNIIYCESESGSSTPQDRASNAQFLIELTKKMPDLFSPYLYFGDYKSNMENENNLCELCVLCGEKFNNLIKLKSRKD